jgi:Fe2+ transport system protein FeoA
VLRYLAERGVGLDAVLQVAARGAPGDDVAVRVGDRSVTLPSSAASAVWVASRP